MLKKKIWMGFGSLTFVLLVSYYFNGEITRNETQKSALAGVSDSRDLASLSPKENLNQSKLLVSQLADGQVSLHSKTGKKPSHFDRLVLEELQGRYLVELNQGKIKSFRFDEQTNTQPLALPDAKQFLLSHQEVWSVSFRTVQSIQDHSSKLRKVFDLNDQDNKKVGRVTFVLDENGLWKSMEFDLQ